MGGDAVGNFALDHEDGAIENGVAGGQLEKDLRSDVVRQVSDDTKRMAGDDRCGGEIELKHVLIENRDACRVKLGAEMGGEGRVEFDGEDMGGAGGECSGDGAGAGADFDDSAAGEIA